MPKRFFIGLISIVAILAGLYQLRIQLLTTALNVLMVKADVRLLHLDGLHIGWRGAHIDRLVLGVGKGSVPQVFQGVHLVYSMVDTQLDSLRVDYAVLTVPSSNVKRAGNAPALLTQFMVQIMSVPLHSLTIAKLELEGMPLAVFRPPLTLDLQWNDHTVAMAATNGDNKLLMILNGRAAGKYLLSVNLARSSAPVIEFQAELAQQGSIHHVEGAGSLWASSALPLLRDLAGFPVSLTGASGKLLFQVSAKLDDDLQKQSGRSAQFRLLQHSLLKFEWEDVDVRFESQWRASQPLHISVLQEVSGDTVFSLTGAAVSWQLNEQLNSLDASGQLLEMQCEFRVMAVCQAGLSLQAQVPQFILKGEQPTSLAQLNVQLSGELMLDDGQLTGLITAGDWLRMQSLVRGDVHMNGAVLTANGGGSFSYNRDSAKFGFSASALKLSVPELKLSDIDISTAVVIKNLQVAGDAQGMLSGHFDLGTDAIHMRRFDTVLPILALNSTVEVSASTLSISGALQGAEHRPVFDFSADYAMGTASGSARIVTHEMSFDAGDNRLSQYFTYWPFEWDVMDGSIALDVTLNWKNGEKGVVVQGEVKQQTRGLAGVYKSTAFVGLDADFSGEFQFPDHFVSTQAAVLSLESLDVGVPIEAISAQFQLDAARRELLLESVEAHLFDGRFWIQDTVFSVGKAHNAVNIGVDGVKLDQLLNQAGYDAIQGTGTLSGLLPLVISERGVTMKRGLLAAQAPGGVIRYNTDIDAGANPAMRQVVEALKNYQYSVLQLEADYVENGDLAMAMVLRGSNPALQQGRPIHLNLNVTDNIPALLKSLQFSRVITDTVSKKVGGGIQ